MNIFPIVNFILSHPLNSGRMLAALSRVIRWQIAVRILPEADFSLPYVNDRRLLIKRGMVGATGNFYCGLHELDEMGFVLHCVKEGDVFVDVGANVGSFTILAADLGAKVIAVEPIPQTYENLVGNIRLNKMEAQVKAHCVGVSNKRGVLRFTTNQDTINHVLAEGEDGPAQEVEVVTLDALLDGAAPTVIKIDVEGHELPVLLGGSNALNSNCLCAVIIETNGSGTRYGVDDSELYHYMDTSGFDAYGYSALEKKLTSVTSLSDIPENTIFIKRDKVAETRARIESASRCTLVNGCI